MSDSKNINVVAVVKAKTGQSAVVKKQLENLVVGSTKEEGCIRYELNQSIDDENVFIFVETWASESILETHNNGPSITSFKNSGVLDLVESLTVYRLELIP